MYRVIQNDRLNFVRLYFLPIQGMWMICITFERGSPKVSITITRPSPGAHSRAAASVESKMATMEPKNFCVYQKRTWNEFKRVLSVAHASQPVELAENLECRNQLSGVCWGAVYSSVESIFFNRPVLPPNKGLPRWEQMCSVLKTFMNNNLNGQNCLNFTVPSQPL